MVQDQEVQQPQEEVSTVDATAHAADSQVTADGFESAVNSETETETESQEENA